MGAVVAQFVRWFILHIPLHGLGVDGADHASVGDGHRRPAAASKASTAATSASMRSANAAWDVRSRSSSEKSIAASTCMRSSIRRSTKLATRFENSPCNERRAFSAAARELASIRWC